MSISSNTEDRVGGERGRRGGQCAKQGAGLTRVELKVRSEEEEEDSELDSLDDGRLKVRVVVASVAAHLVDGLRVLECQPYHLVLVEPGERFEDAAEQLGHAGHAFFAVDEAAAVWVHRTEQDVAALLIDLVRSGRQHLGDVLPVNLGAICLFQGQRHGARAVALQPVHAGAPPAFHLLPRGTAARGALDTDRGLLAVDVGVARALAEEHESGRVVAHARLRDLLLFRAALHHRSRRRLQHVVRHEC